MTHEHYGDEADSREYRGPEHDDSLPDATTIPEYDDVEASFAPPMYDTAEKLLEETFIGAEPGWWERPDIATQLPRWAGTEPNEV